MKTKSELNNDANTVRKQLGLNNFVQFDLLKKILEKFPNMTIIFRPISEKTSGICINNENIQIICINSTMSFVRQRFTLAHKLYHLLIEKDFKFSFCNDNIDSNNDSEKEANIFASFLLISEEALTKYIETNNISNWNLESIINIEQYFQISHETLLNRLKDSNKINKQDFDKYSNVDIINVCKKMNISTKL